MCSGGGSAAAPGSPSAFGRTRLLSVTPSQPKGVGSVFGKPPFTAFPGGAHADGSAPRDLPSAALPGTGAEKGRAAGERPLAAFPGGAGLARLGELGLLHRLRTVSVASEDLAPRGRRSAAAGDTSAQGRHGSVVEGVAAHIRRSALKQPGGAFSAASTPAAGTPEPRRSSASSGGQEFDLNFLEGTRLDAEPRTREPSNAGHSDAGAAGPPGGPDAERRVSASSDSLVLDILTEATGSQASYASRGRHDPAAPFVVDNCKGGPQRNSEGWLPYKPGQGPQRAVHGTGEAGTNPEVHPGWLGVCNPPGEGSAWAAAAMSAIPEVGRQRLSSNATAAVGGTF